MTVERIKQMITLRLKTNHDVVLSEFFLRRCESGWGAEDSDTFFDDRDWETVPPPYELPTGLGAVVKDTEGRRYVLADPGDRTGWITGGIWETEKFVLGRAPLTTLNEGVEA